MTSTQLSKETNPKLRLYMILNAAKVALDSDESSTEINILDLVESVTTETKKWMDFNIHLISASDARFLLGLPDDFRKGMSLIKFGVSQNHCIDMIKGLRMITKCGLKDALDETTRVWNNESGFLVKDWTFTGITFGKKMQTKVGKKSEWVWSY